MFVSTESITYMYMEHRDDTFFVADSQRQIHGAHRRVVIPLQTQREYHVQSTEKRFEIVANLPTMPYEA